MKTRKQELKVYIAGWIRGPSDKPSTLDIKFNIDDVCIRLSELRDYYAAQDIYFYAPHEWINADQEAKLYSKAQQDWVLEHDASILRLCDFMLCVDDPKTSRGMTYEIEVCKQLGIPYGISETVPHAIKVLEAYRKQLAKKETKHD